MPTVISHTIKPAGGGDYTSLESWNTAQRRDLVAADEIAEIVAYSGGNLQSSPTARFQPTASWTTDNTRYVSFTVAAGEGHTGTVDTNKAYMLSTRGGDNQWFLQKCWKTTGVQILHDAPTANVYGSVISYIIAATTGDIEWDNCIFRLRNSTTGGPGAYEVRGGDSKTVFRNCIAHRKFHNVLYSSAHVLKLQTSPGTMELYNCTITSNNSLTGGTWWTAIEYRDTGTTLTMKNVYGAVEQGIFSQEHLARLAVGSPTLTEVTCACSGDGTGTPPFGNASITNVGYDTTVVTSVTIDSEDWSIPNNSSPIANVGTNISGDGITDDIVGTSRPGGLSYDVGAFELDEVVAIDFTGAGTFSLWGGVIGPEAYHGERLDALGGSPTPTSGQLIGVLTSELFQTFKGCGGNILAVSVFVARQGTVAADNYQLEVRATAGTYGTTAVPNGASLEISSNTVAADNAEPTFPSITAYERWDFFFNGTTFLTNDTAYALVLRTGTSSFPNGILWGGDNDDSFGGNAGYWNGATYQQHTNWDFYFVVYTDQAIQAYVPGANGDPDVVINDTDKMKALGYLEGEAVSIEGIWNTALTHIGEAPVSSTSDTSANAVLLNEIWEEFFEEFLLEHTWNGAKTTATLTQLVDSAGAAVTPPTRWQYAFAMPSDYLTGGALTVNGLAMQPQTTVIAEVEAITVDGVKTLALFTNQSTAELEYIFDVGTQVSLLSPKIRAACAMLLAARLAPSFGKSESEIEGYRRRAELTLADARAADGQEGTPRFFAESPLLDARRRYRGGRW